MPRLEGGEQQSATAFVSGGIAASFAFGVRARPPAAAAAAAAAQ
jgi:hypothetical protein